MVKRGVVIDLEVRNRQARAALQGIESGFTKLRRSTKQTTAAARKGTGSLAKGVSKTTDQFRSLNTTIGAFGYAIQDAPFALMTGNFASIGNNLPQIIQGVNQLGSESDTLYDKMKLLATNAFKGPLGLITVANIATAAITILSSGMIEFGSEAEETEAKLDVLNSAIDDYITTATNLQGQATFDPLGQITTERKIGQVRQLKSELQSLFDLRKEAARLQELVRGMSGLTAPVGLEQQQRLTQVNDAIREQERLFGELSKTEGEALQKRLDDLEATSKLNQAMLRLNPTLQFRASLQKQLAPVLRDVELGLSGAEEQLDGLISGYEGQVEAIRNSIEAGNAQGEELNELKDILLSLTEALDKAKKAQEGLNKAQGKAKLTRGQLQNFGWMEQAIKTQRRREQFQQSGLGGTFLDPTVKAHRPEDKILQENPFTPIPQSAVDKEIAKIQQVINETDKLELNLKDLGDTGERAIQGVGNAFGAFVGMLMKGQEEALNFQSILGAIMPALMQVLFPQAGFLQGLARGLFSGFAHGTDAGFPGVGMVGERGKELLVAPPYSSIITNENVERMDRMRKEARQGAHNVMSMNGGSLMTELRDLKRVFQEKELQPVMIDSYLQRKLKEMNFKTDRLGRS